MLFVLGHRLQAASRRSPQSISDCPCDRHGERPADRCRDRRVSLGQFLDKFHLGRIGVGHGQLPQRPVLVARCGPRTNRRSRARPARRPSASCSGNPPATPATGSHRPGSAATARFASVPRFHAHADHLHRLAAIRHGSACPRDSTQWTLPSGQIRRYSTWCSLPCSTASVTDRSTRSRSSG